MSAAGARASRAAALLWLAANRGRRAARAERRRKLGRLLFGSARVLLVNLGSGAPPPLWKTGDKSYAEILKWWASKKVLPADQFAALSDELKGRAGRLAGIYNTQFTQAIYDSLGKAIAQGQDWKSWSKQAQQILDGYMAAGPQKDRLYTGEKWAPWYADLVFRTNGQAAYHAGKYAEMFRPEWVKAAPYLLYSAIHDARTRPEHRVLDGLVFRKDDARARHYLPPLGFGCRCTVIELDEDALQEGGYKVTQGDEVDFTPPKGWDSDRVESLVPKTLKNLKSAQAAEVQALKDAQDAAIAAEKKAAEEAAAKAAWDASPIGKLTNAIHATEEAVSVGGENAIDMGATFGDAWDKAALSSADLEAFYKLDLPPESFSEISYTVKPETIDGYLNQLTPEGAKDILAGKSSGLPRVVQMGGKTWIDPEAVAESLVDGESTRNVRLFDVDGFLAKKAADDRLSLLPPLEAALTGDAGPEAC